MVIAKHDTDVQAVENKQKGFSGIFTRYLWTADDGCPNFAMRMMEFKPQGYTSYHFHQEEHEFYISWREKQHTLILKAMKQGSRLVTHCTCPLTSFTRSRMRAIR
jgi:hypothetical protein